MAFSRWPDIVYIVIPVLFIPLQLAVIHYYTPLFVKYTPARIKMLISSAEGCSIVPEHVFLLWGQHYKMPDSFLTFRDFPLIYQLAFLVHPQQVDACWELGCCQTTVGIILEGGACRDEPRRVQQFHACLLLLRVFVGEN